MTKPDCSSNPLFRTNLLEELFKEGLVIEHEKEMLLSRELLEEHYPDYLCAPFFSAMVRYLTSGQVHAMIIVGEDAVGKVRRILGATRPWEAEPGTLRQKYGRQEPSPDGNIENAAHASDSAESARIEIARFFPELE